MRQIVKGSTDISVDVYIIDSTDGTPETGVTFETSGIDMEYRRQLEAAVNITEVTLALLTTGHADGGFLEIGHGLYRLDLPDAACATGAGEGTVSIQGTVTGMIVLPQTIQLIEGFVVAGTDGVPDVNLTHIIDGAVPAQNVTGVLEVDVTHFVGEVAPAPAATGVPDVNVTHWIDGAVPAQSITGVPEVDVTHFVGEVAPAPAVTGVPDVNMTHHVDVAASITNSELDVNVGQIIGTAPTLDTGNIEVHVVGQDNIALTAQQKTDVEKEVDDALKVLHLDHLIIARGTVEADGSNSNKQVKTDLAEASNDHYNDGTILFLDNAEAGQWRTIDDYVGATGIVSWEDALIGTPANGTEFVLLPVGTSAHNVWETILTGSEHNTATSAGRRLRELGEVAILASGEIVTVTDGRTIELDTGAVGTADFYIGQRLEIEEGTGAGQTRIIVAYSALRVCLLDSSFTTNPDANSLYAVVAADVHTSVSDSDLAEGLVAVATSTTTITLDSGALANADYYKDMMIVFTHGTGAGQSREITNYTVGRVCTLAPALDTAVSTDTIYHIVAVVDIGEIVDEVWDELMAEHVVADSAGLVVGRLARSVAVVQEYTIDNTSFTATTTQAQVDAVDIGSLEATDDHFIGRIIIFTSGANIHQATDITDYDGTNKRFTYTAVTDTPEDDATFIVV